MAGSILLLGCCCCICWEASSLALEVLYVNLGIAYLGDGSAGAEQCAAGGEEVTDNECQKSEAYHYKQQS